MSKINFLDVVGDIQTKAVTQKEIIAACDVIEQAKKKAAAKIVDSHLEQINDKLQAFVNLRSYATRKVSGTVTSHAISMEDENAVIGIANGLASTIKRAGWDVTIENGSYNELDDGWKDTRLIITFKENDDLPSENNDDLIPACSDIVPDPTALI